MLLKLYIIVHLITFITSEIIFDSEENSSENNNQVIVDGEEYSDENRENVTVLYFPITSGNIGNIDIIINFPNLEELHIEKFNLTKLPIFANLPKLVVISLMKNQLKTIRNASFSTTSLKEIYLAKNQISEIYDKSFGSKTTQLFLTCNKLESISSKWFMYPGGLELLNVGGNRIKVLKKDTFNDFTNLKTLDLRLNELKTLEDNSLNLPRLKYLYLSYNNLTEIHGTVFGSGNSVVHLKHLEIKYNWISYITDDFLNKLKVDNFKIWANPWQCACKKKLESWWMKNNNNNVKDLAFEKDTPCITPLSFADICVPAREKYIYEEFSNIFLPRPLKLCSKTEG